MNKKAAHFQAAPRLWADHIEALADEIKRNLTPAEKRGQPATWRLVVNNCEKKPNEVALIVLWCATKQLKDDDENAPSVATVALDIAKELGAGKLLRALLGLERPPQKEALVHVGNNLLAMAADVGMIQSIKGGHREVTRVRLTPSAAARYSEYLRRCIEAGLAQEMLPLAEPPKKPVVPGRNWRGRIEPPPLPPKFVSALEHIRRTPWRVNKAIYQQMFAEQSPDQLRAAYRDSQEPDWESDGEDLDRGAALGIAADWLKYDFYLDARCDYRGRIYHGGALRFNGADKALRPLLEFAEGQPVTTEGAKYLAAYTAAKWEQKGSIDELEKWTLDNDEMLLAIASDPDKHDGWKLLNDDERQDKRWYALACADAWRRYRGGESVHLPCSWDAVTSGLQIYALLMRDVDLGHRVGLMEGSKGTYYEDVGKACGELKPREAAKAVAMPLFYGSEEKTSAMALAKLDKRKDWRAYEERAIRLREEAEAQAESFKLVRDWLQAVASDFYKLRKEIRWTTDVGFEVVQDNQKLERKRVWTAVHGGKDKIAVTLRDPGEGLDWRKQESSIAANLVHSLDASWLVATVNYGAKQGIRSWGTVHDCFATHCNDVRKLRSANKMGMVEVFGLDPLGKLGRQFKEQTEGKTPAPPAHEPKFTHHWAMGERALEPG